MELGGPVWHASAASMNGLTDKNFLRQCALKALRGIGDAENGQWEEWSGYAYHIRRRLSREEQEQVGEPVDVRNTPEATRRHAAVQRYLPAHVKNWKE